MCCSRTRFGKIAFSSLLLLFQVVAAAQQTSTPAPPGKLIDIGGYRLHLNCTGNKGPTVVLLPGAGDFSFDWSLVQPGISQLRLYFLSQPPRAVSRGQEFLAEELRDIYAERAKAAYQLGNIPLIVLLPKPGYGRPPRGIDADEWKRVNEEKRQQKIEFTNLSHNSKLIVTENSGHHIQLDEPQVVIDAVLIVVESSRRHKSLDGKKL